MLSSARRKSRLVCCVRTSSTGSSVGSPSTMSGNLRPKRRSRPLRIAAAMRLRTLSLRCRATPNSAIAHRVLTLRTFTPSSAAAPAARGPPAPPCPESPATMPRLWERGPLARPSVPSGLGGHAYSTEGRAAGRPRSWSLRHCTLPQQHTSLVWALPISLHHGRGPSHSADVRSVPMLRPSRRSTTGTGQRPALPGPSHHNNRSRCSASSLIRAALSCIAGQDATRVL
jgi:hypothetical protein